MIIIPVHFPLHVQQSIPLMDLSLVTQDLDIRACAAVNISNRIGFAIARGVEAQIDILMGFGFHHRMIHWIMECVSYTSFSLSVNGTLHGYFMGQHGLRQGDHMSPYLSTLIMEVLTLMLHRQVHDLFLFAHGDAISAHVIMEALDEFKFVSGLSPSFPKSTAYFYNVLNHTKLSILQILPFEEGRLLVKYLGVPLISSRLVYRDCRELTEKVQNRLKDWKNKSLSAAGRLQLVQSVIGSMHVYWASVFILPSRRWSLVKEDGYVQQGAYDLSYLRASFSKGIFVGEMDSCLQAKGMKFLGCPYSGQHDVGMVKDSPTLSYYSANLFGIELETAGFDISSMVKDVVDNRYWQWPPEWFLKYPVLSMIIVLTIDPNLLDVLEWRNHSGMAMSFSVSMVWDCIRPKGDEINWMLYGSLISFLIMHFIYEWLSNGS
ncbi:hypothetical protein Tco_0631356 [Tanacetum coccineum]